MNQLVTTINNEVVTTSLAIAEGCGLEHHSVIQLVRTYASDLEEFGTLAFQMQKSGGRPTEYAVLNEDQATLTMTYMRNSDIVRDFKKRLVKEFRNMHTALTQPKQLSRLEIAEQLVESIKREEQLLIENKEKALQIEYQNKQIEEAQPLVDYVNDLIVTNEKLSIRNVAKSLHLMESEFRAWLVWCGELLDAGKKSSNRYGVPANSARNRYMDAKRGEPRITEDGEIIQALTPYFTDMGVIHIKKRLKNYKEKYPSKFAISFKGSIDDAFKANAREARLKEFTVI